MKTPDNLIKSRNARLQQAVVLNKNISVLLSKLSTSDGNFGSIMERLRKDTESLMQCVHESSAYNNALET